MWPPLLPQTHGKESISSAPARASRTKGMSWRAFLVTELSAVGEFSNLRISLAELRSVACDQLLRRALNTKKEAVRANACVVSASMSS